MSFSLVSIVPAQHRVALEALGRALGFGGGDVWEHGVPLSADGSAPATHYGLRAWARTETRAAFSGLKANPSAAPPVDGYTPDQISAAIAAVAQDWRDDGPGVGGAHWVAAVSAAGLATAEGEGE